jgi:hypothetical protein
MRWASKLGFVDDLVIADRRAKASSQWARGSSQPSLKALDGKTSACRIGEMGGQVP